MKCDVKECSQEATVHLTEIVNDNITKLHLCEEHAKKKGVEMEQHFGIADLLQGLAEFGPSTLPTQSKKFKCGNCGMTYEDFKKIGRLGCADCYNAFQEHLGPLLKRIHGSNQHTGKTINAPSMSLKPSPSPAPTQQKSLPAAKATKSAPVPAGTDLETLRAKLKKAILSEAYEEAAKLRDQIRTLEMREKRNL